MVAQLTVKLPDTLQRQVRAIAARRGETLSDVVRAALESYVAENQDAEFAAAVEGRHLTEDDALFSLIGIAEGGPADLSTNKHAYTPD